MATTMAVATGEVGAMEEEARVEHRYGPRDKVAIVAYVLWQLVMKSIL